MKHEQWYQEAHDTLSRLATAAQQRHPLDLDEVFRLADALTDSLRSDDHLVIRALSGPAGPPLITNLLNVGILATKVGLGLGYYGVELQRLAVAALVHDVGIFSIPQRILQKTGPVSGEDRVLIEEHPRLGAETILQAGEPYRWLADVVLQAHERWMGQGYPNKLKGREINELAQIIGLVDVFDALISPRPYRRRFLPHEAVRELLTNERNGFPREVMKALVEQLSVYPLGTKVRVNTGEEGTVIAINPKYPSRPRLALNETEQSELGSTRILDLSATPLVWVTDTIAPPDVDRMAPTSAGPGRGQRDQPVRSSDQFAALLESLDAIASVIQTAVDTRGPSPSAAGAPAQRSETSERGPQQAVEGTIETAVLGLFALEAREWIRQIQVALTALDRTDEKARQSELLKIMLEGMTNLARSAATVPLPTIEHMALDLIHVLDAAGRQQRTTTAHSLEALQEGLARLASAVRQLPCDADDDLLKPGAGGAYGSVRSEGREANPPMTEATGPILDALRRLHEARGRSMQPMRDILEEVIHRAEQMEPGASPIDAQCIGRILNDLDALDERFLEQMSDRVPAVVTTIARLEETHHDTPVSRDALTAILHEIEELHDLADQVHATAITTFLQGLRGFLLAAARGKSSDLSHRLQAVRGRLGALVPLAKQWVDLGRIERTAIIDILPV